jgi:type I restriction enzyme, S subunit
VSVLIEGSADPLVANAKRWNRAPLGQVATVVNGFPFKSQFFNDEGRGEPLLRIRDVTSGTAETYYSGPVPEGFWVTSGELVVGMDGDFNSRIWQDRRALLNQRVCKISPDPQRLDARFLAYILPAYLRLINEATHSITVKHLSSRTIAQIPVPLPSLDEQKRIVAKLDALNSRLGDTRAELVKARQLVQRFRHATLSAAISGDLTAGWREERLSTRDTWRVCSLGEITVDVRYGTASKCHYEPEATPVLRIPNVVAGRIDVSDLKYATFSAEERKKLALRAGDVLVIRSNGSPDLVGRTAVVEKSVEGFLFAGYLIRLRFDLEEACPAFVQYALQEPSIRRTVAGLAKSTSGVNNINSEQLRGLRIPLPSLVEQQAIAGRVERAFNLAACVEAEVESADRLLDRLQSATLAAAVQGEIVVPEEERSAQPLRSRSARFRQASARRRSDRKAS